MTYWKYSAYVIGVKNRCRKPDRHHAPTLEKSEKLDPERAAKLAHDWAQANFKTIQQIQATASFHTLDESGTCETWEPMNKEHNFRKTIFPVSV